MAQKTESPYPSPYPPISDYALISDCHSAALVSRDGSIDWCAFHRFDARPVFCRILDWSRGGHFRIAPAGPYEVTRRYIPDTNILETTFETDSGRLVVTDCFAMREELVTQAGKILHPHHQLLRRVRCEDGEVAVDVDFRPRFDYGTTVPRLDLVNDDLACVYGGADALVLQSPLPVQRRDMGECGCRTTLRAGDDEVVALTYYHPHELTADRCPRETLLDRLQETEDCWTGWASRCGYDGPYREHVVRSALVLKALTNTPTGAIVAAPTTSLPEEIGGVRNWDYRYTWLRDASFTLFALFELGYVEEAHDYMSWLKRTTAGRAEELQVLYGVGGEHLLYEFEIPELEGYRGSAPVRVGNAAIHQHQLDTYGELLDTAWQYHEHAGGIDEPFWELLRGAADHVCRIWQEPDEGIWEVRGGRQHFVFSKVMAWVALDRAIRLSEALDLPADGDTWAGVRDEIRERVLADGVDPDTGAFTQAFDSDVLDAANLLIPLIGFLGPDDPRVRATIERTRKELSWDGLVHRYLGTDDGLPGGEGAFALCSFWLVDNLAIIGELEEATELFERLCGFTNDVGLLSEEIDPATGGFLGNFPQAFSHLGLINSAIHLFRYGDQAPDPARRKPED